MNNCYITIKYKNGAVVSFREDTLGVVELLNRSIKISFRRDTKYVGFNPNYSELEKISYEGPYAPFFVDEINRRIKNET